MQLGVKFNNAHLDTSFASIDPKIMKLHPIEGLTPESENCTKSYRPETFEPGCTSLWPSLCYLHLWYEQWRMKKNDIKFIKYDFNKILN